MTDFFQRGNILFIKDYQFDDGSENDKLLIVLDVIDEHNTAYILQVLTTSQRKVPNNLPHGCTNDSLGGFSVYIFKKGKIIGKNHHVDFSFDKDTYILFNNISIQETINFLKYRNEMLYKASLSKSEYKQLITCIVESKLLARKFKPHFKKIFEDIS